MAFSSYGSLGTASLKGAAVSNIATISMNPNRNVPTNRLVVVWYGGDSWHSPASGENDPLNTMMDCRDSAGNVYTTVAGATDGQSNIYSECAIFVGFIRYPLTTSDTITCRQWVETPGQTTARGMSAEEFSTDSTTQWAVHDRLVTKVTNRATNPGAISVSGGQANRQYLYLHALSAEGPNTDTYTWDSTYTQIAGDGTTGGADDTNIHIRGGYRIATITGDTVSVTANTPTRDYTQILQSITEIDGAPDGDFPTVTDILDDFNRADENPVGTTLGNWDTTNCSPFSAGNTARHCEVVSNQLKGNPSFTNGGSWFQLLSPALFDGDGYEGFVTISTLGGCQLDIQGTGCTEGATADGLAIRWETGGNRISNYLNPGSVGNQGGVDGEKGNIWVNLVSGNSIGIQLRRINSSTAENAIYWWIERGNGWEVIFACHSPSSGLSGYATANRRMGLEISDSTCRLDDFGGGPFFATIPQIIRRL